MRWNDWSPPKWSSFPSLCRVLFQSFRMRYVCVLAFHCTNLTCGFALFSSVMSSQQTLSKQVAQNPLMDQKGYMLDEIWQGQCAAAVLTSSKKTRGDHTVQHGIIWRLHNSTSGKNLLCTWSVLHPVSLWILSTWTHELLIWWLELFRRAWSRL